MGNKNVKMNNSKENKERDAYHIEKNSKLFHKISKFFEPPEHVENPLKNIKDLRHKIQKSKLNHHLTYEKIINISQNTLETIPFTLGLYNNIEMLSTGFFLYSLEDDFSNKNKSLNISKNLSSILEIQNVKGNQHKRILLENLNLKGDKENETYYYNTNLKSSTNSELRVTNENSSASFNFDNFEFFQSKPEKIYEHENNPKTQDGNFYKQSSRIAIQDGLNDKNKNFYLKSSQSNLKVDSTSISFNKKNLNINNHNHGKNSFIKTRSISPNADKTDNSSSTNDKKVELHMRSPTKTYYETESKIKKFKLSSYNTKTEVGQNLKNSSKKSSLSPSLIRIKENSNYKSKNFINKSHTKANSKLNYSKSPEKERNYICITNNKRSPEKEMSKIKSRYNLISPYNENYANEIKINHDCTKISTIACEDSNYNKSFNNTIESLSINTYNTNYNNSRDNKISYSDFILKKKESNSPIISPKVNSRYITNNKNSFNYSPKSPSKKGTEDNQKKMKVLKINLKNLQKSNCIMNDKKNYGSNSGNSLIISNGQNERDSPKNFEKNLIPPKSPHTYAKKDSNDYSKRNLELIEIFRNNNKKDEVVQPIEYTNTEFGVNPKTLVNNRNQYTVVKNSYNGINHII